MKYLAALLAVSLWAQAPQPSSQVGTSSGGTGNVVGTGTPIARQVAGFPSTSPTAIVPLTPGADYVAPIENILNGMTGTSNLYSQLNLQSTISVLPSSVAGLNLFNSYGVLTGLAGGSNYHLISSGAYDKTNWAVNYFLNNAHSPGQHWGTWAQVNNYSLGDSLSFFNTVYGCAFTTSGDEGCEFGDNTVRDLNTVYAGTVAGSPGTGAGIITVTSTQGSGTQGAGRYLLDTTTGTSTGTATAISSTSGNTVPMVITVSSATASTVIGQLGTAVLRNSSATVTPSFSVGAISGITTSTVVCIADSEAFETVLPSLVTGSTFTAAFVQSHPATAVIAVGGGCGLALAFTADNVTSATYSGVSITGTIRYALPLISSTSTTITPWNAAGGLWLDYWGKWTSGGAYTLYPSSAVSSVITANALSDTLTLEPNLIPFTTGDIVEEQVYPQSAMTAGNNVLTHLRANPGDVGGAAFPKTYLKGVWTSADIGIGIFNQTDTSLYAPHGGIYTAPSYSNPTGEWNYIINLDRPADSSIINVPCDPTFGCTKTPAILTMSNSGAQDYLGYNQTLKAFVVSYGSSTSTYTFGSTFTIPVPLTGNLVLQNGSALQIKDAGGTARNILSLDGGNYLVLQNPSAGGYVFIRSPSGTFGALSNSNQSKYVMTFQDSGNATFNSNVDNGWPVEFEATAKPIKADGGVIHGAMTYAQITALSSPTNGTLIYCSDCNNFTDDTTGTFDSAIASGGHGTNALYENGAWRVH